MIDHDQSEQNGVQSVPVIQQMHTVGDRMTSHGKEHHNQQTSESLGERTEELQLLESHRTALSGNVLEYRVEQVFLYAAVRCVCTTQLDH